MTIHAIPSPAATPTQKAIRQAFSLSLVAADRARKGLSIEASRIEGRSSIVVFREAIERNEEQLSAEDQAQLWDRELANDAGSLAGEQAYSVLFVSDGEAKPWRSVIVRYAGNPALSKGLPEDPAGTVQISQSNALVQSYGMILAHQDRMFRVFIGATEATQTTMINELRQRNERIAALEAERSTLIKLQEQTLNAQAEREMLRLEVESEQKRKDLQLAKLIEGGTILVQQHLASKRGGAGMKANSLALKQFVESLTKEQFAKLGEALTPEQQGLLAGVFDDVENELAAEKVASAAGAAVAGAAGVKG